MECERCGAELNEGAVVCRRCGLEVEKIPEEKNEINTERKKKRIATILGVIAAILVVFMILWNTGNTGLYRGISWGMTVEDTKRKLSSMGIHYEYNHSNYLGHPQIDIPGYGVLWDVKPYTDPEFNNTLTRVEIKFTDDGKLDEIWVYPDEMDLFEYVTLFEEKYEIASGFKGTHFWSRKSFISIMTDGWNRWVIYRPRQFQTQGYFLDYLEWLGAAIKSLNPFG